MAEENAKLMMKLLQKLPKRPVTSTKSANKSVVIKQPKSFAEMHALTKSNPRKSRSNNLPKPYTPESLSKKPRHSDDCARDSPSPSNVQAIVKSTTTPISPGKSLEPKRKLTSLQEKMAAKLEGSRFRFINEQLYKTTGTEALQSFKEDPELFDIYHSGFQSQVKLWPSNPLDHVVDDIRKIISVVSGQTQGHTSPTLLRIADMGCGEAQLAQTLSAYTSVKVHSFDLVARNDYITCANIAHVPLEDGSMDIVVFCLALMGTDYVKFIVEANRTLRIGFEQLDLIIFRGMVKVAEVQSRITDIDKFTEQFSALGFRATNQVIHSKMFVIMDFVKVKTKLGTSKEFPSVILKPCVYKKR